MLPGSSQPEQMMVLQRHASIEPVAFEWAACVKWELVADSVVMARAVLTCLRDGASLAFAGESEFVGQLLLGHSGTMQADLTRPVKIPHEALRQLFQSSSASQFQHRDLVIHTPIGDNSARMRLQMELWTKEVSKRVFQNIFEASVNIRSNVLQIIVLALYFSLMVQAVVTRVTPLMAIVHGGP